VVYLRYPKLMAAPPVPAYGMVMRLTLPM